MRSALPSLGLIAALSLPGPLIAQVGDATALRQTEVLATIQRDSYDSGTCRARGISHICGKLDLMMPHRVNSFVVEFPDGERNGEVTSLAFNADTLAPGATTSSFYVNGAIRTPTGGTPPACVARATKGTKVRVDALAVCGPT